MMKSVQRDDSCKHISSIWKRLAEHHTDADLPSIIDEAVEFNTSLTDKCKHFYDVCQHSGLVQVNRVGYIFQSACVAVIHHSLAQPWQCYRSI